MTNFIKGECMNTCTGCGGVIQDKFIYKVSPDMVWHGTCLKCCECDILLEDNQKCYVKNGKPMCSRDYIRLYSTRCSACNLVFLKSDIVMRAKTKIFHPECFRCSICCRRLVQGDEYALHGTGIVCRDDLDLVHKEDNNNINIKAELQDSFRDTLSEGYRDEDSFSRGDEDCFREDLSSLEMKSEPDTLRPESPDSTKGDNRSQRLDRQEIGPADLYPPSPSSDNSKNPSASGRGGGRGPAKGRSNRGRTVLTEKQRTILTACFQHNPKPDALLKEQLVEMTGLNARVIRVWFQNRRCKEHKRVKAAVLITRKDHQKIGYGSMNGIPMVATSPVRQDSPDISAVDIHGYHPPWHNMPDFAGLRMDPQDLHFNPQNGGPQMPGFDPNGEMFNSQLHHHNQHFPRDLGFPGPPPLPPPGYPPLPPFPADGPPGVNVRPPSSSDGPGQFIRGTDKKPLPGFQDSPDRKPPHGFSPNIPGGTPGPRGPPGGFQEQDELSSYLSQVEQTV